MTSAGVQREAITGEMKRLTFLTVSQVAGGGQKAMIWSTRKWGPSVHVTHRCRNSTCTRVPCSHKTNKHSELFLRVAVGSGGAFVCGAGVRKITLEYWVRV